MDYFTYKRNWRVKNGRYPTSKKDTKEIFIEILKARVNYTIFDVKEQELTIPQPTKRYVTLLKVETKKARKATDNPYFKFDEEDSVISFNKREYLSDLLKSKIFEICKECGFTRYRKLSHWTLVSKILKEPNANEILYRLLANDRYYQIADEDLKVIRDGHYKK